MLHGVRHIHTSAKPGQHLLYPPSTQHPRTTTSTMFSFCSLLCGGLPWFPRFPACGAHTPLRHGNASMSLNSWMVESFDWGLQVGTKHARSLVNGSSQLSQWVTLGCRRLFFSANYLQRKGLRMLSAHALGSRTYDDHTGICTSPFHSFFYFSPTSQFARRTPQNAGIRVLGGRAQLHNGGSKIDHGRLGTGWSEARSTSGPRVSGKGSLV